MTLSPFASEVRDGLSSRPRQLSSKWFYDATGDQLFQDIMAMPEYYLTDAEREIYQTCGPDLLKELGGQSFELIELGAGDGSKTQYLIDAFLADGADFVYRPVDISANAIDMLGRRVAKQWPRLAYAPLHADYFTALEQLDKQVDTPRLVLFPGANVGNFDPESAVGFLRHLRQYLRSGDLLLTGFDLKKDPAKILAAYNDPAGHTAAFNLNLLHRINRELDADIDVDNWRHWETYDPLTGGTRSYLVAETAQEIHIGALNESFTFDAWEAIAVEVSQKYSRREIDQLCKAADYVHVHHFLDAGAQFSDTLWRVT